MGSLSILFPHRRLKAHLQTSLWLMLLLPVVAETQTLATKVPILLPSSIAFDSKGNLFIAETANHVIRKVDTTGHITTVVGTGTQGYDGDNFPATSALLDSPQGLAVDASSLYIADTHNHRIRKVDLASGIILTIAGSSVSGSAGDNGPAAAATLDRPVSLALDGAGHLFFADAGSHRIRRIDANTHVITTVAGAGIQGYDRDNGSAVFTLLDSPQGIALDEEGNLYLADTHNHRVRRIDASTGIITTIAGTGAFGFSGDSAPSRAASLALPQGLSVDSQGNVYLADTANHRVRRIDGGSGVITTIAGDGTQGFAGTGDVPTSASLSSPRSAFLSPSGLVTIVDTGNQRVRQISGSSIQTIAGLGSTIPASLSLSGDGVVSYGSGQVMATLDSATEATGEITFFDQYAGASNGIGVMPLASNAALLDTSRLSAGLHAITASYSGDSSHSGAQSMAFSLTVNPLPLTAVVAPASINYGETVPVIAGSLEGVLARDQSTVAATYSTDLPIRPTVGVYPVAVTLTGLAAGNYTLSTVPTLTITKAATVTTLAVTTGSLVSATSVDANQPLLLSVHVASRTTGVPAGTIILADGGTLLAAGSATSSGDFTFATSALSAGPHSVTAAYSGDTNFLSSNSPSTLFTVTAPQSGPADFTLASSSATTQTIVSGSSANFSFVVNTQGTLSSPVTLSASGFPNLATASFNPGSIPPGTASGAFTMTIATPKTAQLERLRNPIAFALLLLPLSAFFAGASRSSLPRMLAVLLLSAPLLFSTGCGDRIRAGADTATPTKSYTITVTGTALDNGGETLRHTAVVTLVLQAAN